MVRPEWIDQAREIVRRESKEAETDISKQIHGFLMEDPNGGLFQVAFRIDSRGRIYQIKDNPGRFGLDSLLMGSKAPRYPSRYYQYGYARAVAEEYEMLTVDLLRPTQAWHEEAWRLASGLEIPSGPERSYSLWTAYNQKILELAKERRPKFVELLEPIAKLHGLDAVPWGMATLIKRFVPVIEEYLGEDEPDEPPVRRQRSPKIDALLLYTYLTGYMDDPKAKSIISRIPGFDLDLLSDPIRKVQQIKSDLRISRPTGRPPGRLPKDPERDRQVYELIESQVRYIVGMV